MSWHQYGQVLSVLAVVGVLLLMIVTSFMVLGTIRRRQEQRSLHAVVGSQRFQRSSNVSECGEEVGSMQFLFRGAMDLKNVAARVLEVLASYVAEDYVGAAIVSRESSGQHTVILASSGLPIFRLQEPLKRSFEEYIYAQTDPNEATAICDLKDEFQAFGIPASVLAFLPRDGNGHTALFIAFRSRAASQAIDTLTKLQTFAELAAAAFSMSRRIQRESMLSEAERDYLLGLSHDLREPVLHIRELVCNLETASNDKSRKQWSAAIRQAAEQQLALIDGALQRSGEECRVGNGGQRFLLSSAVGIMSSYLQHAVEVSGNSLHVGKAPACEIRFDVSHFVRVLCNYISNAANYTSNGEIWLDFEVRGARVHISVADNGCGVDPDCRVHLYSSLPENGNKAWQRKRFGLRAVRALAEYNNAEVWYRPRSGGGSVFGISIPVVQQVRQDVREWLRQATVVIAEDDRSSWYAVQRVIVGRVRAVTVVSNPIELQKCLGSGKPPDLLISDLFLSGESVWPLLEKLNGGLPVLIVTAADPAYAGISTDAWRAILQKPFQKQQLITAVEGLAAGWIDGKNSKSRQGVPILANLI